MRLHALWEKVVLPFLCTARPRRDGRAMVRPKYVNPDCPTETWSGRGKIALWLKRKIEEGAELEDFLAPE